MTGALNRASKRGGRNCKSHIFNELSCPVVFHGKPQGLELGAEWCPGGVGFRGLVKVGEKDEVLALAIRPEVCEAKKVSIDAKRNENLRSRRNNQ